METATIGQWVCEHRDPYIANMVHFRRAVAGTDTNHWWDDGADAIAFSRGDKGFVAINREAATVAPTIATGLAAGTYCDIISGGKSGSACVGTSVTIDASGNVTLSLTSNSAIAILSTSKL
jgi:alpha-amylase